VSLPAQAGSTVPPSPPPQPVNYFVPARLPPPPLQCRKIAGSNTRPTDHQPAPLTTAPRNHIGYYIILSLLKFESTERYSKHTLACTL
jgi:hypothetical protein